MILQFIHISHLSKSLKYCHNKSTLSASFHVIFSRTFDMRVENAAEFFDKIFNVMFLLCFSVIRWNFGIFLVLFNGGV